MPRALGEKQEIVDVVSRKRLRLLASHLIQTNCSEILEPMTRRAREISIVSPQVVSRTRGSFLAEQHEPAQPARRHILAT